MLTSTDQYGGSPMCNKGSQLRVKLPRELRHVEVARRLNSASSTPGYVAIDECILKEIQMLWRRGIETHGCCCRHGMPGAMPFINVHERDRDTMLAMGYVELVGEQSLEFRPNSI